MSRIIERALSIINDNLKDQTSSFADPISIKPMARGGRLLEDDYPTHYLPEVGRQVMALGGEPAPVNKALDVAQEMPQTPLPDLRPTPVAPSVQSAEGRVIAPRLANTFASENVPSVVVSPLPGKGSGPRPYQQKGVNYADPEYTGEGPQGEEPSSHEAFSFSSPAIAGAALPPPVQHPLQNEPRMKNISDNTQRIFKSKGFKDLVRDHVGIDPDQLKITPILGTWKNEVEPSFVIDHPDMRHEHAAKLAPLLGFGFQQDQAIHLMHLPEDGDTEGSVPAVMVGHTNNKRLSQKQIDKIIEQSKQESLDFSLTKDGKAAKFLHFGGEEGYNDFLDRVNRIGDAAGLHDRYDIDTKGEPIDAKDYLNRIFPQTSGTEGLQASSERSPDLFGRIVDHILAPYAKAVAGEGYRLSPERLKETFGLTDAEAEKARSSLYPTKKSGDRSTVPLMNGSEQLDVRPTGARNKAVVDDVLFALQNRSAEKGQLDTDDYSDDAKKIIAKDIANEVTYHVNTSKKSAVGWYDAALKKAKNIYHNIFPELKTDKDKEMLFDAILGITSQGNDVHSNSIFAARVYDKMRNQGKALPEAVRDLSGGFGAQTKAIEGNLMKLHHLLDQNGFDRMRDLFNQKKTVSEWNKILREDPKLKVPGQDELSMEGAGDQKVSGWMVFGPKIGSFINNLHGDYSTLTADLWFSRTWNRLLGHNFIHSPMAEQKQYQDFKDAMKAQFMHHNGLPHEQYAGKTTNGQYKRNKKTGEIEPWSFGNDLKDMSHDEFNNIINDPERMQELAAEYYDRYKKGGFKDKSDLYRRAKNWMENRSLPVAAPRGDKEREFQQNTVEEAQKILKKQGLNISIADIQAALWFHEKELFQKLGVAPERAQPADYEDAAKNAMETIKKGELYHVKSKAAPESWYWSKYLKQRAPKAYGGAITPGPRLNDENIDDFARRLILWSYATAPLFHKAEGGAVDPAAKAVDTAREMTEDRQLNPMGFYSAAAEAASKFPQKAPIDQIINKIKGQPNVKKEELDNANLADAFAGQRSVDPQEVARHLQASVPQISEKVYGGKPPVSHPAIEYENDPDNPDEDFPKADSIFTVGPSVSSNGYSKRYWQIAHYGLGSDGHEYNVYDPMGTYHDTFNDLDRATEYINHSINKIEPTEYSQYTIPGGENYREVVMTLPHKENKPIESGPSAATMLFENNMKEKYGSNDFRSIYNKLSPSEIDKYEMLIREDRNSRTTASIIQNKENNYKSSHWKGLDNPLAHLRMSDRDDGKTLHLEELQSDWGQEAQKIRKQEIKRIVKERGIDKKEAGKLVPSDFGFKDLNEEKTDSILDQMFREFSFKVPRAPYVTDTGQWVDLGLKRALMEAAKGGYDKLVWTPGEEQANRYKLSKHVEALSYDPEDKVLSYLPHGGNQGRGYINIPAKIEPYEIEEHIGKDAAEKLLAVEPNKLSGNHVLSGQDLEVGGEGMEAFYDKLVPQRLNKLVAQYDPEAKVKLNSHKITIPGETGQKLIALREIDPTNSSGYEDKDIMVHSIEITPKLREAILKGGLPAFEHGGSVISHALSVLSKLPR